jgi:hypothetical protein
MAKQGLLMTFHSLPAVLRIFLQPPEIPQRPVDLRCLTRMRKRMKQIIVCFLCFLGLISCLPDSDDAFSGILRVNISQATIPSTAAVNENVQMFLRAEAPNGCYKNLEINMTQLDPRHFSVDALAYYQSSGVCPETIVSADTIINFKPTLTGEYYFQINDYPYVITRDTLVVN